MRVLVAWDSFISNELVCKTFQAYLSPIVGQLSFDSFEVRPEDTPSGLSGVDELTFGSPKDIIDRIAGVDILFIHKAPVISEVLEKGADLKVVACARTGPYNVDLLKATELGILVLFTPGRNSVAVADATIGLILNQMRHICKSITWMKGGNWKEGGGSQQKFFLGPELEGKVLGIIGFGQVGSRVAVRARAFGMRVLGYDPYVSPEIMKEQQVESTSLPTLLKESDVVSIHLRLPPTVKPFLGLQELKLMKPSACLINTAVPVAIDQKALYDVLKNGWIAGATQDVWEIEPVGLENPLLHLDNFVSTPGIAGSSLEIPRRSVEMLSSDLARLARDERPLNVRNPEVLSSPNLRKFRTN